MNDRTAMDTRDHFVELIRRYGEKAYNFAYRLAGNEPEARELVQEAFVRAYESFQRYDPSRPFDAWVDRILHNVYMDGVRRCSHRLTVSLDAPPPAAVEALWEELLPGGDEDPMDGLLRRETDALLQKALDSLPVEFRSAVALCDVEGLSYERIGGVMACPIGTVRSRIHQGRLLLRKAFEKLQRKGVNSDV
jgi:RNA polymerase sigma-70 factor (ECF subfamily)